MPAKCLTYDDGRRGRRLSRFTPSECHADYARRHDISRRHDDFAQAGRECDTRASGAEAPMLPSLRS